MIFLCYFGNSMYFCNVFDRHTKIMQHQLNFQIMTQKEFLIAQVLNLQRINTSR